MYRVECRVTVDPSSCAATMRCGPPSGDLAPRSHPSAPPPDHTNCSVTTNSTLFLRTSASMDNVLSEDVYACVMSGAGGLLLISLAMAWQCNRRLNLAERLEELRLEAILAQECADSAPQYDEQQEMELQQYDEPKDGAAAGSRDGPETEDGRDVDV